MEVLFGFPLSCFFFAILFFPFLLANHNWVDIQTSESQADLLHGYFFISCQTFKVIVHHGVGVGRQRGKVNLFVLFKTVLKFKVKTFLLGVVLIDHFLSFLAPLGLRCTNVRFHAAFVETKTFRKLVYSEPEGSLLSRPSLLSLSTLPRRKTTAWGHGYWYLPSCRANILDCPSSQQHWGCRSKTCYWKRCLLPCNLFRSLWLDWTSVLKIGCFCTFDGFEVIVSVFGGVASVEYSSPDPVCRVAAVSFIEILDRYSWILSFFLSLISIGAHGVLNSWYFPLIFLKRADLASIH